MNISRDKTYAYPKVISGWIADRGVCKHAASLHLLLLLIL